MDEVTQQNSALVEQNAAAAKSLEQQSQAMHERVSFFRIEDDTADGRGQRHFAGTKPLRPAQAVAALAAPEKRWTAAANRGPVARMQAALVTAIHGDLGWKKF
jgi:hypothetical protein